MGLSSVFKLLLIFGILVPLKNLSAPSCGPVYTDLSKLPEGLFVENCKKLRASEACQRVEAKIKEAGNNPEDRLVSCTKYGLEREKTLNENSLASSIACLIGVAEFGVDAVVAVGTFIGETSAQIKIQYDNTKERNEKCEKDPLGKRKLFLIYNMLHPNLLQLKVPSDEKLKLFSCNDIEFEIRKQNVIARQRIEPRLIRKAESKNPSEQFSDDESQYLQWMGSNVGKRTPSTPLIAKALDLIKEAGTEYWCYNGIRKRAMMCEAAALAASIYVGGQAMIASRAEKLRKIRDIGGIGSRVVKTEGANATRLSGEGAARYLKASGIKVKNVTVNGKNYTAIVPDKSGHWLARQAEVYSRKYKTDFLLVDPKELADGAAAQVITNGSRNYMMLANNLDFSDIPEVMGYISHELVHARVGAAAIDPSVKANPPMTLTKGSKDIPISGYDEVLGLDEVSAYATQANTYKRSMQMAMDTGDMERFQNFRNMYLFSKDHAVKIHRHTAQSLERVKARVVSIKNPEPIDLGESWAFRVNSGPTEGEELMTILLPKTKATSENFRQELLKRIQTEIDTNQQIINTLTGR